MRTEVSAAIEELRRQFEESTVTVSDDDQGGARVVIEPVSLGPRYRPDHTWIGFHIPAQYPYADIYPVFIGVDCARVDGQPFVPPITPGVVFENRPALQISRRSPAASNGLQKATAKALKILHFLETLP